MSGSREGTRASAGILEHAAMQGTKCPSWKDKSCRRREPEARFRDRAGPRVRRDEVGFGSPLDAAPPRGCSELRTPTQGGREGTLRCGGSGSIGAPSAASAGGSRAPSPWLQQRFRPQQQSRRRLAGCAGGSKRVDRRYGTSAFCLQPSYGREAVFEARFGPSGPRLQAVSTLDPRSAPPGALVSRSKSSGFAPDAGTRRLRPQGGFRR